MTLTEFIAERYRSGMLDREEWERFSGTKWPKIQALIDQEPVTLNLIELLEVFKFFAVEPEQVTFTEDCKFDVARQRFGSRLRFLRERLGFTQQHVAKLSGVGYSTYSQYEANNRNPPYITVVRLAKVLKVSVGFFADCEFPHEKEPEPTTPVMTLENKVPPRPTTQPRPDDDFA